MPIGIPPGILVVGRNYGEQNLIGYVHTVLILGLVTDRDILPVCFGTLEVQGLDSVTSVERPLTNGGYVLLKGYTYKVITVEECILGDSGKTLPMVNSSTL